MEQRIFHFDEATPLLSFLEQHREYIVGHTLNAIYAKCMYTKSMDENMVFLSMDDYCIGIEYLWESDLSILIADQKDFEIDREIHNDSGHKNVHFHSHLPEVRDVYTDWCVWTPGMNQKIVDIKVERFSHKFNSYGDDIRPEGGDYFSAIRLILEDGTKLCFRGLDAITDGYIDVWMEDLPAAKNLPACLRLPDFSVYVHAFFRDILEASHPTPDELASIAMMYMRKCGNLYSAQQDYGYCDSILKTLIKAFCAHGMNKYYVDETGKPLLELLHEIGPVEQWITQYLYDI